MKTKFLFSILIISLVLISCSSNREEENTALFLEGFEAKRDGNLQSAINIFSDASTLEDSTSAVFSTENLISLLYDQKEYALVIEKCNESLAYSEKEKEGAYKTDENYLYRFLLLSMLHLNTSDTNELIAQWVNGVPYSGEHESFFSGTEFSEYLAKGYVPEALQEQIFLQSAVYKRDYGQAIRTIVSSSYYDKDFPERFFENKKEVYLSDIGKATLYGSNDNVFFARSFQKAAESYEVKSTEAFMCYFYAGRLYEESGHSNTALESFEKAMNAAIEDKHYDNALWYYLTTVRKISSRSAISVLQDYAPSWKDPSYFDDFLDALAFQLLDNENYKGFYALYNFLDPYMSPVSVSKYAYISALLLESDYVAAENNKETEIRDLYKIAYNAVNGSLYYRMMSSVKLNISTSEVLQSLLERDRITVQTDNTFENILLEYFDRGYIEEGYSLYMKNSDLVSVETVIMLSRKLSLINTPSIENNYDDNFYPESLRLASRGFSVSDKNIPREDMTLLYPKYYTDFVTQSAETYKLEEFLIYALMRSESFFDHDVMSWAGAIGLTQLMPSTAGDVARKLKVKDYDLHNARQNIDFGMFYFDELIPREGVDNSILRALFSYNAGITNVRRWNRLFPELQDNPALFLEKIPFAETREYGRKVLSAAVMYGLLYYDMEIEAVVNAVMN